MTQVLTEKPENTEHTSVNIFDMEQSDKPMTLLDITKALQELEMQLKDKLTANFRKQREISIRQIRLQYIETEFKLEEADSILYNEEVVKLYHEARNTAFFAASFDKYLNKQFELH